MTFEEWAYQILQQIGQLEMKRAQLKRKLNEIEEHEGRSSPEAAALMRQINELGAHLLRMDQEYSALLKADGCGIFGAVETGGLDHRVRQKFLPPGKIELDK